VSARGRILLAIGFENGVPVSVNGVGMKLVELMESLATITGREPAAAVDAACEAFDRCGGTMTGVVDLDGLDEPRMRGTVR